MQLSMPAPGFLGRWWARGARQTTDGAVCAADLPRAPRDAFERFVLDYLAAHAPVGRTQLLAAVTAWLGQRERSLAGGVGDLGVWGDGIWEDEALRRIARLDGDLIALSN